MRIRIEGINIEEDLLHLLLILLIHHKTKEKEIKKKGILIKEKRLREMIGKIKKYQYLIFPTVK